MKNSFLQTAVAVYIHLECTDTSTAPSDECKKCCPNILSHLQIIPKATKAANIKIRTSMSQSQFHVITLTVHTYLMFTQL